MSDTVLIAIANALAFVAWLNFVFTYHTRSTWWDNRWGRSLMVVSVIITVLLGLALATWIIEDLEYPPSVAIVMFLLLGIGAIDRTYLMVREQNRQRAVRDEEDRKKP